MITLRHITVGMTPLDERSARRRDLYLITHKSQATDTHNPSRIRAHNPKKRAAAVQRLRPRDAPAITQRKRSAMPVQ
jgi:hypothetical protein